MGLTSQVPSDEYVIFYDLLLAGIKVEPGLSHKQYREIKKHGSALDLEASSSTTNEDQITHNS